MYGNHQHCFRWTLSRVPRAPCTDDPPLACSAFSIAGGRDTPDGSASPLAESTRMVSRPGEGGLPLEPDRACPLGVGVVSRRVEDPEAVGAALAAA